MKQKGSLQIILIIVILLALIGIIFLTFIYKNADQVSKKGGPLAPTPGPTIVTYPSSDPSLIVGWKTYVNNPFAIQMLYPKEFVYSDVNPNSTASAAIKALARVAFTDSNKNQFTLNIYPISTDSKTNTTLSNIAEYSGVCGVSGAQKTLLNDIEKVGNITYKKVAQIDKNGRYLTDFCFFNPAGNLIVLRNNASSTEIAMKLILSTVQFAN